HVEDRLVGARAVVLEHVVLLAAGDFRDRAAETRQDAADGGRALVAELAEGGLRLFRDPQRVASRDRADVEEGEDVRVLVDFMRGDLATQDLTEDRIAHARIIAASGLAKRPGTLDMAARYARAATPRDEDSRWMTIDELIDTFAFLDDWMEKYKLIIE